MYWSLHDPVDNSPSQRNTQFILLVSKVRNTTQRLVSANKEQILGNPGMVVQAKLGDVQSDLRSLCNEV